MSEKRLTFFVPNMDHFLGKTWSKIIYLRSLQESIHNTCCISYAISSVPLGFLTDGYHTFFKIVRETKITQIFKVWLPRYSKLLMALRTRLSKLIGSMNPSIHLTVNLIFQISTQFFKNQSVVMTHICKKKEYS